MIERLELALRRKQAREAELRAERHDDVSSTHRHPASVDTMTRSSSGDKMAVRDTFSGEVRDEPTPGSPRLSSAQLTKPQMAYAFNCQSGAHCELVLIPTAFHPSRLRAPGTRRTG